MLDNPIDAYLRVAEAQNRNRTQANQDLAGIGQGLGQAGQAIGQIGEMNKQKKQKEQWYKTINSMMQNPNLPPQMKQMLPMIAQRPELMGQIGPQLLKTQTPPKPANVYRPFGTNSGLVIDESTGKVTDSGFRPKPPKNQDALDAKEQARQDKLEKTYQDRVQRVVAARTGGLGLQDQKVDQAIHLRSMINQSWNPQTKTYELPEMQQGELVMGLANLVSGSSVSNIEQLKSITPKTARGDAAHLISYWTGKPLTTQPQEMIKNLISSIDRQGQVSQKLRDKYTEGLKNLVPSGLNKERADQIRNTELTSSFEDILKESPDQGGSSGGTSGWTYVGPAQ